MFVFMSLAVHNAQTDEQKLNLRGTFFFKTSSCKKYSLQDVCDYRHKASGVLKLLNFIPHNLPLAAVSFCYMTTCLPSFSQAGDIALKEESGHVPYNPAQQNGDSEHFTHSQPMQVLKQHIQWQHNVRERFWMEVWNVCITSVVLRVEKYSCSRKYSDPLTARKICVVYSIQFNFWSFLLLLLRFNDWLEDKLSHSFHITLCDEVCRFFFFPSNLMKPDGTCHEEWDEQIQVCKLPVEMFSRKGSQKSVCFQLSTV